MPGRPNRRRAVDAHHVGEILRSPLDKVLLRNRSAFFVMRDGSIRYFQRGVPHRDAIRHVDPKHIEGAGAVRVVRENMIGIEKQSNQLGHLPKTSQEAAEDAKLHVKEQLKAIRGDRALDGVYFGEL
jgi:hypothetical protein